MRAKTLMITSIVLLLFIAGGVVYYYHPYKLEHLGQTDKIWAHRVNSLEKLAHTQKKYTGLELDVVFDTVTNTFDVTHPPTPSIGLTLETWMQSLDPDKGVWIDFKNLTAANKKASLERLLKIAAQNNLKNEQFIVESQHPQHLQDYTAAGFQTSYYLPSRLYALSEENLQERLWEINSRMQSHPTTYISTNIEDYNLIAAHFPEQEKLLWSLFTTYNKQLFSNYRLSRKALKDPKVNVLLVRVNRSTGHR